MKNVIVFLSICIGISCKQTSDTDEMRLHVEKVVGQMKITTIPESLIFNHQDSIPIVINCRYKDSALCCGNGEIRFVIDDTLDYDRIYKDSAYRYSYCGCGDTIYLKHVKNGNHILNGGLSWNAGDWTYGKDWSKKITIK